MKNIQDLAKRMAKKNNLTVKDNQAYITELFGEMSNILTEEKEEIRIKNFGVFKFGKVPGKKTKHPKTKEPISIPDMITIRLGLSTKLKKGLN